MKPLRIDYIAPTGWRWPWACFAIGAVCLLAAVAWRASGLITSIYDINASIAQLQQAAEGQDATPPTTTDANAKSADTSKAIRLLDFDMNKVFAPLEQVNVRGAKLTNMTLNMEAGTVELVYDLERPSRAHDISDALNSGYDSHPWHLTQVESYENPDANGLANPTGAQTPASGTWRAVVWGL